MIVPESECEESKDQISDLKVPELENTENKTSDETVEIPVSDEKVSETKVEEEVKVEVDESKNEEVKSKVEENKNEEVKSKDEKKTEEVEVTETTVETENEKKEQAEPSKDNFSLDRLDEYFDIEFLTERVFDSNNTYEDRKAIRSRVRKLKAQKNGTDTPTTKTPKPTTESIKQKNGTDTPTTKTAVTRTEQLQTEKTYHSKSATSSP